MKRQDKSAAQISGGPTTKEQNENSQALVVIPEKKEAPATEKKEEPKPKDIQTILAHTDRMNKLLAKRESLDKVLKNLDSFDLESDKVGDQLTIEDANGNEFKTSKTSFIAAVVELIKTRAAAEVEKVEAEILAHATANS